MNANGRQGLGISRCWFAIRIHWRRLRVVQDHPFPLQPGPFEIQKQANLVACDPQIVEHPPPFMVRDGLLLIQKLCWKIIGVHWRSLAFIGG